MSLKQALIILTAFFVLLIFIAIILSMLFLNENFFDLTSVFNPGIAVIQIKGPISNESSMFSPFPTAQDIINQLDKAENDASISAILLEIDSPGGTIVATKEIVRKIREINKPVVSFISGIGASGAYYVAASTDFIVADPDSITGSIGVISVSPNLEGLLEKIGIKMKILKEGKFKDIGSPFKEMTPEEQEILQSILHATFNRFKKDVLEFRSNKISEKDFNKIADGRILSGEQAFQIGLIDELGGKQTAVNIAAKLAGIKGKPVLKDFSNQSTQNLFSILSKAGYAFGTGFKTAFYSNANTIIQS
jgi:protease-4